MLDVTQRLVCAHLTKFARSFSSKLMVSKSFSLYSTFCKGLCLGFTEITTVLSVDAV